LGVAAATGVLPIAIGIAVPIITGVLSGLLLAQPALGLLAPMLGLAFAGTSLLLAVLPIAGIVLAILIESLPGPVGTAPLPNCNQRTLTHAGQTLVNTLIGERMIIDVDHTDKVTFDAILDIAKARHYPGIEAGHTGLLGAANTQAETIPFLAAGETFNYEHSGRHEGNKTDQQAQDILDLGGIFSLGLGAGSRAAIKTHSSGQVPFDCGKSSDGFAQAYLYAIRDRHMTSLSFGSDLNGFSGWPAPRFGPEYCGSAHDTGPGYGPATTGITYDAALTDYFGVHLEQYQFGNRTWDYNVDGFAHIGMYPDFIADLQAHGLTHADLAPLFNGAEAYVRMWERVDDDQPPTVRCGTVGTDWHAADVTVPCIAFDPGWGLAHAADASFSLSTSVANGSETNNASTGTHADVCDVDPGGANCSAVQAITGIRVDKKPPTITLTTPPGGIPVYTVNQSVTAQYSCVDGGSGLQTCAGPVASGAPLDTNVGVHSFTVNTTDNVNNAASTAHPYNVAFAICPLYDSAVTKKAGSTVPIKLQLCDANGRNLSSAAIVVHAAGVTLTSTNTPAALGDSGNANPDFDFRYDSALGGYIFNLSTKGYGAGTYVLNFTAGSDPTTHAASFAVR
jgi:microsomal dipeptidase-like Zn-dependent dipeptidase